jgi:hypothetical protein
MNNNYNMNNGQNNMQGQNFINNGQTVVNNQVMQDKGPIIEKYLPKIIKSSESKTGMILLIIGGILAVAGVIANFAIEEGLFIMMFGLVIGLVFVVIGLVEMNKSKKQIPVNFNDVQTELYASDCYLIEAAKLFFTRSYLVSYGNTKFAIAYKNIVYAYTQHHQQNTSVQTNSLLGSVIVAGVEAAVATANGTQDVVIKTPTGGTYVVFAFKQEEEIMYLIQKNNPSCLMGNNSENNKAYKEIKNRYKNMVGTPQQPYPQYNPNIYNQYNNQQPQQPMGPLMQQAQQQGPVQQSYPQQMMPNNQQYTNNDPNRPRSYSGNINDQSTYNRF